MKWADHSARSGRIPRRSCLTPAIVPNYNYHNISKNNNQLHANTTYLRISNQAIGRFTQILNLHVK